MQEFTTSAPTSLARARLPRRAHGLRRVEVGDVLDGARLTRARAVSRRVLGRPHRRFERRQPRNEHDLRPSVGAPSADSLALSSLTMSISGVMPSRSRRHAIEQTSR